MKDGRPDHHDAELMLRVYELRREPVMREARNAINGQFWPRTADDVMAVTKPDHPLNAAWRQTTSYWEMVYSFARHGLVAPDFWVESNGEGLFLFAKVLPHLTRLRSDISPTLLRNTEWVVTQTEEGKRLVGYFGDRVSKVLAAR